MSYRSFSLIPTLSNNLLTDRFTQMDHLFSRLTGEKPLADSPTYNLLQKGPQHELIVSVPGYTQDELDVSVLNNQLNVHGRPHVETTNEAEEKEGVKWLHHGIKKSDFSLKFTLDHRIIIQQANIANGLLYLHFTYDIPEQEKPQQITINNQNQSSCNLEHNLS